MSSSEKYLRDQIIANVVINMVGNGVIAYFMYRARQGLSFVEIAFDIPITVAILTFLVGWIAIASARKEIAAGKLTRPEGSGRFPVRLPAGAFVRTLVLTVTMVLVYGGLMLVGPVYLLGSGGVSNWVYILFKTLYTGACAGLAAAIGILTVLGEELAQQGVRSEEEVGA